MKSVNFVILGEQSIANDFGKKGTVTDLTLYDTIIPIQGTFIASIYDTYGDGLYGSQWSCEIDGDYTISFQARHIPAGFVEMELRGVDVYGHSCCICTEN